MSSTYTVGDTEYQCLFEQYKKKCLSDLSKLSTIYLEPNFYKLIALENILFLKPGSYSTDMLRIFTEANLNKLYKHLLKTHCSFDKGKHTELLNLIDGIFEKACFDYHQVEANLDPLSHGTEDAWSKRIIRCVHENIAYSKVKSSYYTNRTRALILDMYRLVYFSKATIDTHQINAPNMLLLVGLKDALIIIISLNAKKHLVQAQTSSDHISSSRNRGLFAQHHQETSCNA